MEQKHIITKTLKQHNGLNHMVTPADYQIKKLLQNPSNQNEILIFDRFHLETTYCYDIINCKYKLYKLNQWPDILINKYSCTHSKTCTVINGAITIQLHIMQQ